MCIALTLRPKQYFKLSKLASDLTELCDPERLLLLFLSFDLSRPLALAFSISIASDAPGWFFSGPGAHVGLRLA